MGIQNRSPTSYLPLVFICPTARIRLLLHVTDYVIAIGLGVGVGLGVGLGLVCTVNNISTIM